MHIIELTGSDTASCDGLTVTTNGRKDPIAPLCRKLIAIGAKPTDLVSVRRLGLEVFRLVRLSKWGKCDIIEYDDRGIVQRPWAACPFNANGQQDEI